MFDTHFRTLFLTSPARLSYEKKHLVLEQDEKEAIKIPLSDILCVIVESQRVTFSSYLLDKLALNKSIVYICDESHLPSGIYMPFIAHYRHLNILQAQIALSKQQKAILWQSIIKAKISNQAKLLELVDKQKLNKQIAELESLSKNVYLGDSKNNEAKAAAIYFKALFGKSFSRKTQMIEDSYIGSINAALNYGYAIVRGVIVRSLCASGLNPTLGIFHANSFNPFNLADDLIESYRAFIDSKVMFMLENGRLQKGLGKEERVELVQILNTAVQIEGKIYPLHRAVIKSVNSFVNALDRQNTLELPKLKEGKGNGREIYESASDV